LANVGYGRIEVVLGDIVEQEADAIVNAANAKLSGGRRRRHPLSTGSA
jgi:hypothetical protein